MMFWLAVTGMVAVAVVDDCLIRRTVTHDEPGDESAESLTEKSRLEPRPGKFSGFEENKERILRALQAHYYFGSSNQFRRDYAEQEGAKVEVAPRVA